MELPKKHFGLLEPRLPHYEFTRWQLLITSLICFSTPAFLLFPSYPFHVGFVYCGVASGLMHLLLFVFFNRLFPLIPLTLVLLSIWNVILIGFIVHFSGGIASPFIFLFISILTSEAIYGIEYPLSTWVALGTYVSVVALEYFQILPRHAISSNDIYKSGFFTVFTAVSNLVYIGLAGSMLKIITKNLRKAIENENVKKVKYLKQLAVLDAQSQLGSVVSKIVHDMRGPLSAISGFISVIRSENKLTPESDEDCRLMVEELGRVSNIMNRLIKYGKPGLMEKTPLCMKDVLENVLTVISFYPGAHNITFKRRFPETVPCQVFATKEELQQVYFNILKNAIEALEKNEGERAIICKVASEDPYVTIEIADNGVGFDAARLARLWKEPASTKPDGGGLGLSIVKEILEAYKGSVNIFSKEGEGTRVVTRLPIYKENVLTGSKT